MTNTATKLPVRLAACMVVFAALTLPTIAPAAVRTAHNGLGITSVYCYAYRNAIGIETEMTNESDFLIQPLGYNLNVEIWNGHEWTIYRSHLVELEDGGTAPNSYALSVPGGRYYRVNVFYDWDRPEGNASGEETVATYTQYGNTPQTLRRHYQRADYCST